MVERPAEAVGEWDRGAHERSRCARQQQPPAGQRGLQGGQGCARPQRHSGGEERDDEGDSQAQLAQARHRNAILNAALSR